MQGDFELRSKPKRRKNLGNFQGEIRVNELRYQAFVNPVFNPPSPNENTHNESDIDSVDGAYEEVDKQCYSSSGQKKQDSTHFSDADTLPLNSISSSPSNQCRFNLRRSRQQPIQSPFTRNTSPCDGPYRAFSPVLFDDPISSVASFADAEQWSRLLSPKSKHFKPINRDQLPDKPPQPPLKSPPRSPSPKPSPNILIEQQSPQPVKHQDVDDAGLQLKVEDDPHQPVILSTPPTGARCPPTRRNQQQASPQPSKSPLHDVSPPTKGTSKKQQQQPDITTEAAFALLPSRAQLRHFSSTVKRYSATQRFQYASHFCQPPEFPRSHQQPSTTLASLTEPYTSGSHQYLLVKEMVKDYQGLFCSVDPLAVDSEMYRLISSEIRGIVRQFKREQEMKIDADRPPLTVEDCWKHRPLIRYLIEKHLMTVFKSSRIHDAQKEAEIANSASNRVNQTLELSMWERIFTKPSISTRLEQVGDSSNVRSEIIEQPDMLHSGAFSSSSKEIGINLLRTPSNCSYADLCQTFRSFSEQVKTGTENVILEDCCLYFRCRNYQIGKNR